HRRWPERFWITRLGRSSSSGRVWRHRLPLTALVPTTMMWDGIAHAASVSVQPSSNVPVYNIQATCREVSSISEARLSESGEPDATKRCTDDENRAREQLLERWPKFKAADRTMCAGASRSGTVS